MTELPNPFCESVVLDVRAADTAVASSPPPIPDAAANRFVLDEVALAEAIEPAPLFLSAPRPEYLDAIPDAVLAVLAGY